MMWPAVSEILSVKAIKSTVLVALAGLMFSSLTSAQVSQAPKDPADQSNASGSSAAPVPDQKSAEPTILIHLVGGGRLEVEEARETSDGVWYKRGSVTTLLDAKRVARIERPQIAALKPTSEKNSRSTTWTIADSAKVEKFFQSKFGRPLPTTAFGQSDLHNRWGLDHRQGIDVGLHPDSVEGLALREFLTTERIPFMIFRTAIPGVATGPHIHIGNASHRFLPR